MILPAVLAQFVGLIRYSSSHFVVNKQFYLIFNLILSSIWFILLQLISSPLRPDWRSTLTGNYHFDGLLFIWWSVCFIATDEGFVRSSPPARREPLISVSSDFSDVSMIIDSPSREQKFELPMTAPFYQSEGSMTRSHTSNQLLPVQNSVTDNSGSIFSISDGQSLEHLHDPLPKPSAPPPESWKIWNKNIFKMPFFLNFFNSSWYGFLYHFITQKYETGKYKNIKYFLVVLYYNNTLWYSLPSQFKRMKITQLLWTMHKSKPRWLYITVSSVFSFIILISVLGALHTCNPFTKFYLHLLIMPWCFPTNFQKYIVTVILNFSK